MTASAGTSALCGFVALDLPTGLQQAMTPAIARLEQEIPGVQWMDPPRMHLTLRFLGWTTRDRLSVLEPHLAAAARACPPVEATVAGLGTFPPSGRPRVLWVGLALPRSCTALQAACESVALECGFPPERRAFQAHLTLGRWKEPARRSALPPFDLGATRLEQMVLYRSEPGKGEAAVPGLRRTVASYSKLAVFPLG